VRIAFERRDERLRPEMGVRIVFLDEEGARTSAEKVESVIAIPAAARVQIGGVEGCFALERDVARFRPLELGESRSGQIVVRSGLRAGEQVVLDPPAGLSDGDRIRIRED
jgi:multidrug efflux pump subunit AcrA (membrane-fusion protein)